MRLLRRLPPFPPVFWLLITCFFFNRVGSSLIWPFITLYIREQTASPLATAGLLTKVSAFQAIAGSNPLNIPVTLTTVASLLSLQALASVIGTSFISTLMDRFGRKVVMLLGLVGFSAVLVFMGGANQIWQWVVLIPLYGILQPVFYIGVNAMVADMVTPKERTSAFAIVRTVSNFAIAIGPAVFGVAISQSHSLSYLISIVINVSLLLPLIFFIRETLASEHKTQKTSVGYGSLLRDRPFVTFIAVYALIEIAAALVFNLLSVYTHENFHIPENQFGQILAVNALMVVFFQYGVTRITRRYKPLIAMAVGSLFYSAGLMGFALSTQVLYFSLSMAVMTIGELMVSPTSTALVAEMAPPDKRARYMGIYSLTYTFGTGVGPVMGGILADSFGPSAIWYGGAVTAVLAAIGFSWMLRAQASASVPDTAANPLPDTPTAS